jgi:glutaredoxin-related protein
VTPASVLVVFTKHDCPLCDEFTRRLRQHHIRFEKRDIRTDLDLLGRYRDRVPVVRLPDGQEIDPPFSDVTLATWSRDYR